MNNHDLTGTEVYLKELAKGDNKPIVILWLMFILFIFFVGVSSPAYYHFIQAIHG